MEYAIWLCAYVPGRSFWACIRIGRLPATTTIVSGTALRGCRIIDSFSMPSLVKRLCHFEYIDLIGCVVVTTRDSEGETMERLGNEASEHPQTTIVCSSLTYKPANPLSLLFLNL